MDEKKVVIAEQPNLNMLQRLSKIGKKVDVIKKDKDGYNYKYADITEILAKIKVGMKEQKISLIPSIVPGTISMTPVVSEKVKFAKGSTTPYYEHKTEILYSAEMLFTWVSDEDPNDRIEIPWSVVGMQEDPSQAFGSAITYCTRYFLTSYFQIAQDNDVDKYRSMQKVAEQQTAKEENDEILSTLDTEVRTFLADKPDMKAQTKEFFTKYVKNGAYMTIKQPILSNKVLEEFRKFVEERGK